MAKTTKTFKYGNHDVTLETGEVARQASGAVMVHMAGTVVLVQHRKTTATALSTDGGTLTRITGGEVSLRTDKDGKRPVGEGAKRTRTDIRTAD